MKTFCLLIFVVALANSVVALEANETLFEANKTHTRHGSKDQSSSSSKQLQLMSRHGSKDQSSSSSKQLQLMPLGQSLVVTKTDEKLGGFASISVKYAKRIGGVCKTMFPTKYAAMKARVDAMAATSPFANAATALAAFKAKHPAKYAGLAIASSVAFAAGDAIISSVIVFFCPIAGGILIADAAIELASAVYGMAGGGATDEQTARVAFQGLSLVLAIGGIDGLAGVSTGLAEAMGEVWYGAGGNAAGEFTDAMGGNLKPADKAKVKEQERNDALKAALTASGKSVTAGTKKRKIIFGGDPAEDHFKLAVTECKKP